MACYLGIDVGAVSVKGCLVWDSATDPLLASLSRQSSLLVRPPWDERYDRSLYERVLITPYARLKGSPVTATATLLREITTVVPVKEIAGARVCGSGARLVAQALGINSENEFRALAKGAGELHPEVSTVFEMGGQASKYLALERDKESGSVGIADYEKSGDCAAGTGSFLDQQAGRLEFDIEDVGNVVSSTERSAKIAGRCSVFAKSDMIHAQQKGYTPPEVLKGLCEAVARNFKSSVIKGKRIQPPVLFAGGVSANAGVARAISETFRLEETDLFTSGFYAWLPALGTALSEQRSASHGGLKGLDQLLNTASVPGQSFPVSNPLSMENVLLLRDRVNPRAMNGEIVDAYLGIDIGSVSTNVVLVDETGHMIKEIYTRTQGRPIEVVNRCLKEVEEEFGRSVRIQGVGTTGSGRELIGELIGADTINDEITAHKTGAEFLAGRMLETSPDTIFEIGGQDSKYISLEKGVVVDFAMNEACAAGTGSFLEERAEELGISIKGEFAELALSSKAPIRLGERCTVFMQQDVSMYQQRGADRADLAAGLAYSIVLNYLNRVVRDRKIGETIFFQGGTAYNDAIAAAFARVLGKQIIVPPYNGVVGAVGAALLAMEKAAVRKGPSSFRGFKVEEVEYSLREFTCKACSNYCSIQEFNVEGQKTYWGDQCSDKFRRRQASEKEPVIDDLLGMRRELLFRDYDPYADGRLTIGMPKGMYVWEQFPFWNTFFRELGFKVLLSNETNGTIARIGNETSVAEPCFPIQAYHGHFESLAQSDVDRIFVPNMINAETPLPNMNSHYCPWGQTLPWVLRSASVFEAARDRMLTPTIKFREGAPSVVRSLYESLKPLGIRKKDIAAAVGKAYTKQREFNETLLDAGRTALDALTKLNEIGIVIVGRTYTMNDRGMTLDIGSKLRDYYGVNVIPMDFLPVDGEDISDINSNMYWNYGRKIIAAARIVGRHPNLHIIYFTNFKCGPDSYIKHYITKASGKPFLTLQFDGHGNDAGYITRCEAYLDSKGALRWWTRSPEAGITRSGAA